MVFSFVGDCLSRKSNHMGGCHFLYGYTTLKCDPMGVGGLYQQVHHWVALVIF